MTGICAFIHLLTMAAEPQAALTLADIHLRDPFIVAAEEDKTYYLFGTKAPGFKVFASKDLKQWTGPAPAFTPPEDFWAKRDFWAPEVHAYDGKWYMFATFKADGTCRGTQILVADVPQGPYRPHSDGPITPRDWESLDGTLFIDDGGTPWMVFCHEWVQVGDGTMCAIQLDKELRKAVGEPVLLFRASEAPWVEEIGRDPRGRVTDGPFMHRLKDGTLLMLWSSFEKGHYALTTARSASGKLEGPWIHRKEPVYTDDGGHGMLFKTFQGELLLTLHQPNHRGPERPRLFRVKEEDRDIALEPWE